MDAKGVALTSLGSVYGYLQKTSAVSQDYYPERLGKLFVINAPWGFSSAFSIVKKFLDPVTVAKIHILGSNYQDELQKQVPVENLPTYLGGTCECKEGCTFSDAGPWQDPQWVKPPKWAREDEAKKENQDSDAKASNDASTGAAEVKAPIVDGEAKAEEPVKATA